MLSKGRHIFASYLYANYNPIPPRSKAPEIGAEIGHATWELVKDQDFILRDLWIALCKRWALEFLKDPAPGEEDDLQTAFTFYGTPENEQKLISAIGHRRMQSPDDESMIDLVNPSESSSEELFRLADKLESYGNQCIERAAYIRRLAKLRKARGA
jgi:hypothetical protein